MLSQMTNLGMFGWGFLHDSKDVESLYVFDSLFLWHLFSVTHKPKKGAERARDRERGRGRVSVVGFNGVSGVVSIFFTFEDWCSGERRWAKGGFFRNFELWD